MRISWFFICNNLNPLYPRMRCGKFGWNCPVVLEMKMKIWKVCDNANNDDNNDNRILSQLVFAMVKIQGLTSYSSDILLFSKEISLFREDMVEDCSSDFCLYICLSFLSSSNSARHWVWSCWRVLWSCWSFSISSWTVDSWSKSSSLWFCKQPSLRMLANLDTPKFSIREFNKVSNLREKSMVSSILECWCRRAFLIFSFSRKRSPTIFSGKRHFKLSLYEIFVTLVTISLNQEMFQKHICSPWCKIQN